MSASKDNVIARQPSPYSESSRTRPPEGTVEAYHASVCLRHDLDELARGLSRDSLETLLVVAKRLSRAEERAQ